MIEQGDGALAKTAGSPWGYEENGQGSAAAPCVAFPAEHLAAARGHWKHDRLSYGGLWREQKRRRSIRSGPGQTAWRGNTS